MPQPQKPVTTATTATSSHTDNTNTTGTGTGPVAENNSNSHDFADWYNHVDFDNCEPINTQHSINQRVGTPPPLRKP